MTTLILKNTVFGFSNRTILNDINETLDQGSYCLEGENGSGKSTTLKTLAGILKPIAGAIIVNNFDLTTHAFEAKCHLSYMPDEPCVYPFMTGSDLIHMVAYFKQTKTNEFTHSLIKDLGIEPYMGTRFDAMSLGTQRKFTFVCALLNKPKLLLLDEPMNGLDALSIDVICAALKNIAHDSLILFSSHQPTLKYFLNAHVLKISEKKLLHS